MPIGQLAAWRGRRMTRTSWAKYLPPNWAPMPDLLGDLRGSRSSHAESRNARPPAEPVVGEVIE